MKQSPMPKKTGIVVLACSVLATSPAPAVTPQEIFASASSPEKVVQMTVESALQNPSSSPSLVLEVASRLSLDMTEEDFLSALKVMLSTLSKNLPDELPAILSKLTEKYPDLAIELAAACVRANPSLVEQIAEAVMKAAPSTDTEKLSEALSSAAGKKIDSLDYIFAKYGSPAASATLFPGLGTGFGGGGSGGGPIYSE